jgi:hypothetical protein
MAPWIRAIPVAAALAACAPAYAQQPSDPLEPPPPDGPPLTEQTRHVDVGLGENGPGMFADDRFTATGIRHVRLTVPYDIVRRGGPRLAYTDHWLSSARDHGLEVLVSFGYSLRRKLRWHLPKAREYRARLREFRARYPWVREFSTWNEANHKRVQPSGKRPGRTALLYRELRRQCREAGCRALAADVLVTDSPRTWRWIRAFRRRAGRGPHTWGVHNYPDVNRRAARRTRRFLRAVPGEVWFTETGGIVKFGRTWRRSEARAALAVRYTFRLAAALPRVTRVYLYNWQATSRNRRWDSGLISPAGRPRPGYFTMLDMLQTERFRPLSPEERAPAPLPEE